MRPQSTARLNRVCVAAYLLAIGAVYVFVRGVYRPENMDDAWFLSFAHSHVVAGLEHDVTFGAAAGGGGFGGVVLFGKTYTILYGHILNLAGWTKGNTFTLSTICMIGAALCWWHILLRLGFSRRQATGFSLAMMLVEPFFGAANQARPDALLLLVASGAMALFVSRYYALSGLAALVAFEIHPIGIIAGLYMASAAFALHVRGGTTQPSWRSILPRLGVGVALGTVYYLALHGRHLPLLWETLTQGNTGDVRVHSMLYEYFFRTKYLRHLPELATIVACAALFLVRRHFREAPFVAALLAASLVFAFIIRRPNFMYVLYVYPAFLLLCLWIAERYGKLNHALVLLLLYLLPQYGFVAYRNRNWNMDAYVAQVRELVPSGTCTVVGRANDWFAFRERPFVINEYRGDFRAAVGEAFILIEGDRFRNGEHPATASIIAEHYVARECGRFDNRGEIVIVKQLTLKPQTAP